MKNIVYLTPAFFLITFFTQSLSLAEPVKSESKDINKKKPVLPTLIVFDLIPELGVEKGAANLLTEIIIDRASETGRYSVLGQKDLEKMFVWEQNKQMKGCDDTKCMVRIAGAMGAEYFIEGSVGAFADLYIISIKLVDQSNVKVVRRETIRIKKDDKELMAAVENLCEIMFQTQDDKDLSKKVSEKPGDKKYPMNPYKLWGHATFWTGLAFAVGGGISTGMAVHYANVYRQNLSPDADKNRILSNQLAVSFYSIGGALMVTGVVLWILSPGDEAWAKKHAINIIPSLGDKGGNLMIVGRW